FAHRLSVTTSSPDQLQRQLAAFANGQDSETLRQGYVPTHQPVPKVAFLFTGQGSQYGEMGRALYATQPTFRQTLDHCAELLHPFLEESLLDVLYPDRE